MPRMSDQVPQRAAAIGEVRGRPKTFASDRVCEHDGCPTRLSRYNPRTLCWQHDPGRPFVLNTGRRRRARGPVVIDG